jgi:RNA polymerase sigma-70 factor (ECF subfamily)
MLGSVHDAEDAVQETLLRAWRAYDRFEGRSSVRTWLYRIATNTCLTAMEGRGRRPLPTGLGGPAEDPSAPLAENQEVPWLEPIPDAFSSAAGADPAEVAAARASTRLAIVAALQYLPPKQRAVLLLREVLQWQAAEVAEALETSTASVNSALQRARAQLRAAAPSEDAVAEPESPAQRELLDRYVKALESKHIPSIVELFTEDAVWEMPPFLTWVRTPTSIGTLIDTQCPAGPDEMRLLPTRANGQPAFAMYRLVDGAWQAFQLQVLELRDGAVAHVAAFFDTRLFPLFGFPLSQEYEALA